MHARLRHISWITLALVVAGASPAAAIAQGARDPPGEGRLVSLVNRERVSRGLGSLSIEPHLVAAAGRQATRMAASLDIWHNASLAREVPGDWRDIGENVGSSNTTLADLHEAFMASAGHRDNILYPGFNEIGVGQATGADGRIYVAVMFAGRPRAPVSNVLRLEPTETPIPSRTVAILLQLITLDRATYLVR